MSHAYSSRNSSRQSLLSWGFAPGPPRSKVVAIKELTFGPTRSPDCRCRPSCGTPTGGSADTCPTLLLGCKAKESEPGPCGHRDLALIARSKHGGAKRYLRP